MRKKYLSALLFGVALTTATGTFVSCSDYDDDIKDLQEQIDKLASADDVKNAISDMNAAVAQAKSEAEAKAAAAQAVADAAKTAAENAQSSADAAQAVADAAAAKAAELEANGATKAEVEAAQEAADKAAAAASQAAQDADAAIKAAKAEALAAAQAAQTAADDAAAAATELAKSVAELEKNGADKASVAAAQAAADAAAAAAKKAQETADAAKTAAANAQTAADAAATAAQAAATDASSALSKIEAIDTRLTALKNKVDNMSNEAIERNISQLQNDVNVLRIALIDVIGDYSTMVTSVSLYAYSPSHSHWFDTNNVYGGGNVTVNGTADVNGNVTASGWVQLDYTYAYGTTGSSQQLCPLDFIKAVEKTTTFGPKGEVVFKEGNVKTYEDSLLIRVSPTTAILNKDNISLINSQGKDLSEFVTVAAVKPYEELETTNIWRPATKASSLNNGLWKVIFKLKENYKAEDLAAAIEVPVEGNKDYAKAIRFAVAIKNTQKEVAEDRRVISSYDVTVLAKEAEALGELKFTATNDAGKAVDVAEIRNRFDFGYLDIDGNWKNTMYEFPELVWRDQKSDIAENIVTDTSKDTWNASSSYTDCRGWSSQQQPLLPVAKDQPIEIQIDGDIKAFYVTLDSDRAVESGNSEINAWNSYSYENLNTVQYGNSGSITIKGLNNVTGDIIGFRVYAVNLDGTLLDPDGRAFYVSVGDVKETNLIEGSIRADESESGLIALEKGMFTEELAKMIASPLNGEATAANNDESIWNNNGTFKYTFYKADKTTLVSGANLKDAAYVKFSWSDEAADYQDNQTYTQVVTFKNANGNILKEVTMKMTKVMPTDFPSSFSAKANQIVNGTYTCYLQPNTDSWLIGAEPVSAGYMDLVSAFNGLDDPNIKFTFAGSRKVGNDIKEVTVVDPYRLTIANDGNNFIKNGNSHATTVTYVYKGISTYKDKDGNWKSRQNYPVEWSTKFNTVYACWHSASSWAWKAGTAATDKQITYGAKNKTVATAKIQSTNSYNSAVFSKTLSEMLTGTTTKYLKLVEGKSKLISKSTGIEDYFDVVENVTNGTLTFVPKIDDIQSNPKENVASQLQIVCEDSFGCQFTIYLDFTVLKQ